MPRPERPENLVAMLADLRRRLEHRERRDAFGDKRRFSAAAGGMLAHPVLLVDEDARGSLPVTGSFVNVAMFAPAVSGQLTVHALGNGADGELLIELYHPATARVLATSTALGLHTLTGGAIVRAATAWDGALAKAATVYAATAVLRARSTNTATTNRITIMSARWGAPNV